MVELGRKTVFILPSKPTLGLLLLIGLLFLLAVNFQNALVYAVCFWLLALLLINVFYTWRNVAGLQVQAVGVEPCFVGDKAVVEIELSCAPRQRKFALQLSWPDEDSVQVNLATHNTVRVKLSHLTARRGWFQPPRVRIASAYPTGLALAWAYVALPVQGLVYPQPLERSFPEHDLSAQTSQDGREIAGGSSDFGGVRAYQVGDAPKHLHWGKYAQTGKLYTKTFVDYASHALWLDWDSLPMPGVEVRLSHLCSQVLAFHQAQRHYGLKLPGVTIEPGQGEAHQARCLRALALFGVEDA